MFLLHNLVRFGDLLHSLGVDASPGRMIDAASALEQVSLGNRGDVYHTLRAVLVRKREDLALFDQAFDLFWRKPPEGELAHLPQIGWVDKRKDTLITPPLVQPDDDSDVHETPAAEPEQKLIEITRTPSTLETLRTKDFAEMSGEELEQVKRVMAEMVWTLGQRRTRRTVNGAERPIDMRRTLRRAMRQGGEFTELSFRAPRFKPRPIVVLADISGSMDSYARLLLYFLYALTEGLDQRVESFVFATRLTRVTRFLSQREIEPALKRVTASVKDWSGGTKIGAAIERFNLDWGRRVLSGGAVVLIISDGWDCGDPALLEKQMERLHLTAHQVIWLNPLLGSPGYEPVTRGMQAALPHIDRFMPVHNLASLEALAAHLAGL